MLTTFWYRTICTHPCSRTAAQTCTGIASTMCGICTIIKTRNTLTTFTNKCVVDTFHFARGCIANTTQSILRCSVKRAGTKTLDGGVFSVCTIDSYPRTIAGHKWNPTINPTPRSFTCTISCGHVTRTVSGTIVWAWQHRCFTCHAMKRGFTFTLTIHTDSMFFITVAIKGTQFFGAASRPITAPPWIAFALSSCSITCPMQGTTLTTGKTDGTTIHS